MRSVAIGVVVGVLGVVAGTLAGCGGTRNVAHARAWPGLAQEKVLDVQVVRDGRELRMTNTSTRSFGKSTIWLNQRFSKPIEAWPAGKSLTLSLNDFVDEYSTGFRAGGFFASESPVRVVLTQIETMGEDGAPEMLGLVTLGKQEMQ